MGINYYNSEHYPDPTPYEAVRCMEGELFKYRPLVYICSPYAGDIEANVKNAQLYCRMAVNNGYIPIAPHLIFPQFMNDEIPRERELGMFFGNVLMSKCAEVWVFGSFISSGMEDEIKRAKRKNYRLRYFSKNCEEVHNG